MSYGDFKYWIRRTFDGKLLHDKAFNIAKNPKYDGYQRGLTSMINNFLLLVVALKVKIFLIKN